MLSKSVILIASGALAGCSAPQVGGVSTAGNEPPASPVDPSAAANVDKNLARLKALDVFEVGELIVDLPVNAYACAGPCSGSAPVINEAKTRAAVRLSELADAAENALARPSGMDACAQEAIDANVAALQALRIVSVTGLIAEQPMNNGRCYNVPCPEDIAAAKAATCERADKLADIVVGAKGL